jgi:hypothetical protein
MKKEGIRLMSNVPVSCIVTSAHIDLNKCINEAK